MKHGMFTMKDGELTMENMKVLLVLLSGIPTWQRILSIYIIMESSYVIFPSRMAGYCYCKISPGSDICTVGRFYLLHLGGEGWVKSHPIGFSNRRKWLFNAGSIRKKNRRLSKKMQIIHFKPATCCELLHPAALYFLNSFIPEDPLLNNPSPLHFIRPPCCSARSRFSA